MTSGVRGASSTMACMLAIILPSNSAADILDQSPFGMRTDTAQPIRLKDYRPPDWLVETVALDVSLHPTQTQSPRHARAQAQPGGGGRAAGARRRRAHAHRAQARWNRAAAGKLCGDARQPDHSAGAEPARSRSRSRRWSIRPPTPSSPGCTARAAPFARNAKPKASAASLISPTGPT